MAEGNEEDIFSPAGSSPASEEDIFSTGLESELAGSIGESPYAFTSSATISLFSSGSHSEDQQIQDFLGPSLGGHVTVPEVPSGHASLHSNGGPFSKDLQVASTSDSYASSVALSTRSDESSPVSPTSWRLSGLYLIDMFP